eukprot:GFUD01002326.1.p1 GENE.GFUD01002326.1~~GFUD01002326.1.p1  ORF type:complete len:292 (-),score=86.97 GFUD01002326.1:45-920(-)
MSDLYSYSDEFEDSQEEYSAEEYNSEDDEFLAFHDADIEAQVKAEVEKMKMRRTDAELKNIQLVETTDKAKVDRILADQVEVVGSLTLYERINKNFLDAKFEPFFAKEQFDLYSWREDFFHSSFPEEFWFTDGGDDSHAFDTVPFQITKNFDKVVALACSPRNDQFKVYFESDESSSAKARTRFDTNTVMYDESLLDKEFLEAEGLSFSDAAHAIVVVFQSGPQKLEYLAMKKVLEYQIPLEDVPKELQAKAVLGMHDASDDIPECINDQGTETFEILRTNFGFSDDNIKN